MRASNSFSQRTHERFHEGRDDTEEFTARFEFVRSIASGSFGSVSAGRDRDTGKLVAIKEEIKADDRSSQILYEKKVLDRIKVAPKHVCPYHPFPTVKWSGIVDGKDVIVLDLMGKSLDAVLKQTKTLNRDGKERFSIHTAFAIGAKAVRALQVLHLSDMIHRDIKPGNIVVGNLSEPGKVTPGVFLIDFGMIKRLVNPRVGKMLRFTEVGSFMGTLRYASIAAHRCIEQSMRDDVESMLYVIANLSVGSLPWKTSMKAARKGKKKKKSEKITKKEKRILNAEVARFKVTVDPRSLVHSKIGEDFAAMFEHVRRLRFEEKPDYDFIVRTMESIRDRSRPYKWEKALLQSI